MRTNQQRTRFILHVDADAFFASVEQALNPDLRGLAVMVGGSDRGVVTAASYEARKFGVHSAMPVVKARRLCPHGIFVRPNFSAYKEFSRIMFQIIREYSPAVERTSIDEGYVDLTGTLRLHRAPPWEIAHRILRRIREQLEIGCSGGLARTRTWAKMTTSLAKPDGLLYLDPAKASVILGTLPATKIPGVGKKAGAKLERHGVVTVGDLASAKPEFLRSILGKWGEKLAHMALGKDFGPLRVHPRDSQKSYSKDRTLREDTRDYSLIMKVARELAEKLAERIRADGVGATTVTLKLRYADFLETSRSMSLSEPTNGNAEILNSVGKLFPKTVTRTMSIRKVGVKLSGIDAPFVQMDLFDPSRVSRIRKDRAIDAVRQRFGFDAVRVSDPA